jgi:TetR/AcrR family transcriptional regulator, repressor for uid operon
MALPNKRATETDKSALRRQQILEAATECFRREGFHGSSIARISQAAGMSPGHIYHYFANKEAIVEAIATREENDMADLVLKLEQDADGDLVTRLTRHTVQMVERNSDPGYVGLMLEMAAEAARNPSVAAIIQRSDQAIAARFRQLLGRLGAPQGMDAEELDLRLDMIAALFGGLALRSLINPGRDHAATARLANSLITTLMADKT